MAGLTYLSVPYASADPAESRRRAEAAVATMAELMISGQAVVCPLVMNLPAMERLKGGERKPLKAYWIQLERELSAACSDLAILALPGWRESKGVGREIKLFREAGKPIWLIGAHGESLEDFQEPSEPRD